jgi:hypothetical protein
MPINGMLTGQDIQVIIADSVQGTLTFNIRTMVDIKQLTKQIKSVSLEGRTLYADLPEGWGWDLDFDQADSKLLNFVARNEATYLAGGQVGVMTGTAIITNVDGSKSQYRFTGGTLKLTNGGMFKGLEKTTQKATITWSRMLIAT